MVATGWHDAHISAFPDGVTYIVHIEIPDVGQDHYIDGVPGETAEQAVEWLMAQLEAHGMRVYSEGGKLRVDRDSLA